MESVVMVNGLSKWDGEFIDKATGQKIVGTPYTKIFFISDSMDNSQHKKGYFETSYKGNFELFNKVNPNILPCNCELKIEIKRDFKGNAQAWVTDITPKV